VRTGRLERLPTERRSTRSAGDRAGTRARALSRTNSLTERCAARAAVCSIRFAEGVSRRSSFSFRVSVCATVLSLAACLISLDHSIDRPDNVMTTASMFQFSFVVEFHHPRPPPTSGVAQVSDSLRPARDRSLATETIARAHLAGCHYLRISGSSKESTTSHQRSNFASAAPGP